MSLQTNKQPRGHEEASNEGCNLGPRGNDFTDITLLYLLFKYLRLVSMSAQCPPPLFVLSAPKLLSGVGGWVIQDFVQKASKPTHYTSVCRSKCTKCGKHATLKERVHNQKHREMHLGCIVC
jgi:hypothetical protein